MKKVKALVSIAVLVALLMIGLLFILNNKTERIVKVGVVDTSLSKEYFNNAYKLYNETMMQSEASHADMVVDIIQGQYNKCEIYLANVLQNNNTGSIEDIVRALDWLKDNKVEVICMSLATTKDNELLRDKVEELSRQGIVIVAACINYSNIICYPANYPEVISVSNCDSPNAILSITNKEIKDYLKSLKWKDCGTSALTAYVTGKIAYVIASEKFNLEKIEICYLSKFF